MRPPEKGSIADPDKARGLTTIGRRLLRRTTIGLPLEASGRQERHASTRAEKAVAASRSFATMRRPEDMEPRIIEPSRSGVLTQDAAEVVEHQGRLADQIKCVRHTGDAGAADSARDRRRLGQSLAKRGQLRLLVGIEIALSRRCAEGPCTRSHRPNGTRRRPTSVARMAPRDLDNTARARSRPES